MQNLTEFLESNGELKAEEMNEVKGGDGDLASIGQSVLMGSAAAVAGGFYWNGWEIGTGLGGIDQQD